MIVWSVVLVPLAMLAVPLGLAHLETWMLNDGPGHGQRGKRDELFAARQAMDLM